jgi:hypothetical protein
LQTQKGQEAKATTAHEFGDVMHCFSEKLEEVMAAQNMHFEPIWSFDHSHAHDFWVKGEDTRIRSPAGFVRMPLPAHCCDFQKVIEHTFGRFKKQLHDLIYRYCSSHATPDIPLAQMRQLCVQAIERAADKAAVKADVDSLPVTLQIVARDKSTVFQMAYKNRMRRLVGTGGDWPNKGFR